MLLVFPQALAAVCKPFWSQIVLTAAGNSEKAGNSGKQQKSVGDASAYLCVHDGGVNDSPGMLFEFG